MPFYIWLAALAVVISVPLLVWSLAGAVRQHAPSAVRRITDTPNLRGIILQKRGSDRVVDPFLASLSDRARQLTPQAMTSSVERRVAAAGVGATWPVERVLAIKVLTAGLGAILGVMLMVAGFSVMRMLVGVLLVLFGWFAPDLILVGRARDRLERIEHDLPDVLDQMTVSVEAGLGFDAAMARLADEGGSDVAVEFGRVMRDVQVGVPRRLAMERMLQRSDSPSMRHVVTALTQADRLGVPLANALRVLADELREKRRVTAHERAVKMPVKLSFPLVLCVMPALFVVILGPALVRMIDTGLM